MGWRLWLVLCSVMLLGACHLIFPYESRQGSEAGADGQTLDRGGRPDAPVREDRLDKATPKPDKTRPDKTTSDKPKPKPDQATPSLDAARPKPDTTSPFVPPGTWITLNKGSFYMGSPSNEPCRDAYREEWHKVVLSHRFEIMAHEVTRDQFKVVVGYLPGKIMACAGDCAVGMLNWHEAAAYCNRLSQKTGNPTCYGCSGTKDQVKCTEHPKYTQSKFYNCPGYRLPTDAEWEYAYRAGTSTSLYNGSISDCDKDSTADKIAWYKHNSGGKVQQVGYQKQPNKWGLYDMAGNVYEWVNDYYQSGLGTATVQDPGGPTAGMYRVLRGGSFHQESKRTRAAWRQGEQPGSGALDAYGLRCVRTKP